MIFESLSADICRYLLIFVDMSIFVNIYRYFSIYPSIFVDICRYLSIFIDICRYLSIFVNICWSLSKFVDIGRYLSIFVDIYRYLSISVGHRSVNHVCFHSKTSWCKSFLKIWQVHSYFFHFISFKNSIQRGRDGGTWYFERVPASRGGAISFELLPFELLFIRTIVHFNYCTWDHVSSWNEQ